MPLIPAMKHSIVEDARFKPWESGGSIDDHAFYAAVDYLRTLEESDIAELAQDVLGNSALLGEEANERLYKAFKERDDSLEAFSRVVTDAASDAWEIAMSPNKSDYEYALEQALEAVVNEADDFLEVDSYPMEDVIAYLGMKSSEVVREVTAGNVHVSQKPGWYDAYIVSDIGNAPIVKSLLTKPIPSISRLKGVKEWMPTSVVKKVDLEYVLDKSLTNINYNVKEKFFQFLEKIVEDKSPDNEFDFNRPWLAFLRDKEVVKDVRKELIRFLKTSKGERNG